MPYKIITALLFTFFSFFAIADEVIIIKDVKISASDKNSSLARNNAIEKGQIRSFHELVKLHYPNATHKANKIREEQIFNTIESFELADEKRSSTHYFAKISVRFSKSQVEKLMTDLGGKFAEAAQPNIAVEPALNTQPISASLPTMDSLIMPIFEQDGTSYWFDDENTWLNFWQKKLAHSTSTQFTLPIGDLEDIAIINKTILNKNIIDLSPLFGRYGINNIALVKLKRSENDSQPNFSLQVDYINRFNSSWQQHIFPQISNSDINFIMMQYYQEIQKFSFNSGQTFADSLVTKEPQTIIIDFPIKQISDWLALEQVLANIKYVTQIELERVNLHAYRFNLTYNIELEKLHNLLRSYNFILQDAEDGRYALIKGEAHAQ